MAMASSAIDLRAAEGLLRELEAADEFSGVVGITQGDRDLLLNAYGYASRAWKVRTITKLFTAVATLQLVERGAFELDTSVTDYLALDGTAISPAVTPYHLLTHTSGIGDDAEEEAGERYEDLFRERPNYSVIETRDFLPQFTAKPPNFAPGEGCRYASSGVREAAARASIGLRQVSQSRRASAGGSRRTGTGSRARRGSTTER